MPSSARNEDPATPEVASRILEFGAATHRRAFDSIVGAWRSNDHREILAKLALSAP